MRKISVLLVFSLLLSLVLSFNVFPVAAAAATVELKAGVINEWEAESEALIIRDGYEIKNDEDASGGQCISVTEQVAFAPSWPKDAVAEVTYTLDVKEEGIYYFWLRVNARDTGADSTFIFFDNAPPSLSEFIHWGEYKWYLCSTETLTVGTHTVNFLHREKMLKFDKFILTTVPDFNPAGEKYSTPEFLPEFGESASVYYPLPAVTPPANEHPRVLLRRDDIPRIKSNLEHPQNIGTYKKLLEEAEGDYDGVFPPLVSTQYTNVVGAHLSCGEANAFLYLMTGERAYAEKACKIAVNAMKTMTNRKGGDTATRVGGDTIFVVGKIYDWCYDVMTDEQRSEIASYMFLHISLMEVGWPTVEQGDMNTHAQEGQLWVDLMCAGIAMYDEDPKLYNAVAGRVLTRMVPIKNFMYNTPFHTEGANYGPFRYSYEVLCAIIFDNMGYSNIFNPNMQYQRYGDFWLRRPDGKYFKTGDDGLEDKFGFMGSYYNGFFYAGNYFKDPYLKREAFRTNTNGVFSGSGQQVTTSAMFLIINDVDVPLNATFRDFGLTVYGGQPVNRMVARTSWEEGLKSEALVVNMNIQGHNYSGHQHNDAGHFDIYYKGNLAIDSGIYQSAPWSKNGVAVASLAHSSEHDWHYHKATIAHNAMLVEDPNETTLNPYLKVLDGGQKYNQAGTYAEKNYDFATGEQSKTGEVISYDYGPDVTYPAYSYIKGDIAKAYTTKVKEYTRSFMFLNFFDKEYPGALIVLDNITSANKSFKKTWLIHSQEKPVIDGDTITIKRTEFGNNGRLINQTILPKDITSTLVGGAGKEFLVKDELFNAVPKSAIQEAGKWRIEINPKKESERDIFLNVMQMSDNNDEIKPLEVKYLDGTANYAGIEIKDRVVYLRTDGKIGSKNVKVKSDSKEGKFMYIADGLKEGTWEVYNKNGKKIDSQLSYEGNNTISFEAEAGEYILKWKYSSNGKKDFINETKPVDSNPYDIKIDYVYESFKNSYQAEDQKIYIDIKEACYKMDVTYTEEGSILTASTGSIIDLDKKKAVLNGKEYELPSLTLKDGIYFAELTEIASALGMESAYNFLSNLAFIRNPESSVEKFQMINSDEPDRVRIKKIVACPETTESPYSSVDNNAGSYWAAPGKGMWIMFEFEQPEVLTSIDLKWLSGHVRKENFELFVSEDGENFELIFKGDSAGNTEDFEKYKVNLDKEYKFVKVVGYENTVNSWNSLAEIQIYKVVR